MGSLQHEEVYQTITLQAQVQHGVRMHPIYCTVSPSTQVPCGPFAMLSKIAMLFSGKIEVDKYPESKGLRG